MSQIQMEDLYPCQTEGRTDFFCACGYKSSSFSADLNAHFCSSFKGSRQIIPLWKTMSFNMVSLNSWNPAKDAKSPESHQPLLKTSDPEGAIWTALLLLSGPSAQRLNLCARSCIECHTPVFILTFFIHYFISHLSFLVFCWTLQQSTLFVNFSSFCFCAAESAGSISVPTCAKNQRTHVSLKHSGWKCSSGRALLNHKWNVLSCHSHRECRDQSILCVNFHCRLFILWMKDFQPVII